jgi:thiamine kinase-like enzyme
MKLSQLVLRENFYKILEITIKKNSFFSKPSINDDYETYKSFQYLNIILSTSLPNNVRDVLVFEYTLTKSTIKKLLQKLYVFLAFFPGISNLFVHKRLKFLKKLNKYAIVPGNHRIRFFRSDLNEIIVLLKEGERVKFIKNDINARFKNNISYAPKILSHGPDWLIEEFITGVPFNRVKENLNEAIDLLAKNHLRELINKEKRTITIEKYLQYCLDEIYSLTNILINNNSIKTKILNTVNKMLVSIRNEKIVDIEMSLTHGDFQKGNMRINSKNEIYILDWEAADRRFYLYDLFVMLSEIRSGNDLESSFTLFFNNIDRFDNIDIKYSKKITIALLCFEELRFNLHEDISENYFHPGVKCINVVKSIDEYLFSLN